MRVCTKPKVYLVAKTTINASGIEQFLEEQSLEWPTEGLDVPTTCDAEARLEKVMARGGDRSICDEEDARGLLELQKAVVRLHPKQAEQLTELAGRCCYMSFGKKAGSKTNRAYLDNLLGRTSDGGFRDGPAHGSVLEHANFSFLVVGAGRGFSHEQVRHRAGWAYSQLSTRYCDFERDEADEGTWDPGFTVPPLGQLDASTQQAIVASHQAALDAYKRVLVMIEANLVANPEFMASLEAYPEKERKRMLRKAARGAARDVLPNGTEAIMVMTANARAIWNTIYLRASEHAEAEIRDVYVQVARIMEREMPAVFRGLRYEKLWDGSEAVILPRDKI